MEKYFLILKKLNYKIIATMNTKYGKVYKLMDVYGPITRTGFVTIICIYICCKIIIST